MKYLWIDLKKDIKAQYNENYKICCRKLKSKSMEKDIVHMDWKIQ